MHEQKKIEQEVHVVFNYEIIFTQYVFAPSNSVLIDVIRKIPFTNKPAVAVVIDEGVSLAAPEITTAITRYFASYDYLVGIENIKVIKGGESVKNDPAYAEQILQWINDRKIDRHSFLIAIGGGAVLDTVGYAAAIAHRGIRHVRIPTTVLSQNDSGIGVKNGINYFSKKNFLGTFTPPFAVINDSRFLTTLSDRDWRSGISEAVKVALIKDSPFFRWIEENALALHRRDLSIMEHLVFRCAQLHATHIATSGDPFEKGSSRPLDFGHWAAHKMEQLTHFDITHGEAVAVGISLDAAYSYCSGRISETDLNRILNSFISIGLPITHPVLRYQFASILDGLEEFREHLGGELTVMLLASIGKGEEVHELDKILLAQSADYLFSYQQVNVLLS